MWRRRSTQPRRGSRAHWRASPLAAALVLVGVLAPAAPIGGGLPVRAAGPSCGAADGQALIDTGRYQQALREFSCLIEADPTGVDGYRGRAEALLLLGRFSDAYADYYRGINAFVIPADPDAIKTVHAQYAARLAADPRSVPALTGASFARWVWFDYPQAAHILDDLLDVRPDDVYGTLFLGSSRVLKGMTRSRGIADLERAIALDPDSPDVHYIVADAYTYGMPDPERAFAEASFALERGLDIPRVRAILAFAELAFGNEAAAAEHIERHIAFVTTDLRTAPPLVSDAALSLDLVPGRVFDVPIPALAGQTIDVSTSSPDFYDTIGILLAPDGTPVTGSDDSNFYFAALEWPAEVTGTYVFRVTSFEAVDTGELRVVRD